MPKRPVGVLSLGILVLALAISASAFATNFLVNVFEILSFTLILFGLWIMILGGMRSVSPEQYGGGFFNTFSGGVLLTALGVIWSLYIREILVEYLFATLLLIVGIMIAVAGIRAWRR